MSDVMQGMPDPAGLVDHVEMVDSLASVLWIWFPNNSYQHFWFSTSRDHEIRSRFGKLLEDVGRLSFEDIVRIVNTHTRTQTVQLLLSIVVVLDQFTRNLHRSSRPEDIEKKATNDRVVMQLLEHYREMITEYGFENLHHVIFFLLPYRHRGTPDDLRYCVSKINEINTFLNSNPDPVKQKIFKHFCKATFAQIASTPEFFRAILFEPTGAILYMTNHLPVLDENCRSGSEEYIGWNPMKSQTQSSSPLIQAIKTQVRELGIKKACVSLSGGVDSITILFILLWMREMKVIDHLCAVYSHCGDRKEMDMEHDFLVELCSSFNVPLRIVYARFGTDCIVDRGVFDTATRDARFEAYRWCMLHFGSTHFFFGHHLGDRVENVVNNAKKNVCLDHTQPFSTIYGVNICRPYYHVATKTQIFDFATEHRLPYFRNTTDERSTRWNIRTQMVPRLEQGDLEEWERLCNIVGGERKEVFGDVHEFIEHAVSASRAVEEKKAAEMALAMESVVTYKHGFRIVNTMPEPILRLLVGKLLKTVPKDAPWNKFMAYVTGSNHLGLLKFSEQFMTCLEGESIFFVDLRILPGKKKLPPLRRDALSDAIWTVVVTEEEKKECIPLNPATFLNGHFDVRFPTCECKKTEPDPKYANSVYDAGIMYSRVPRVLCGGRPCKTLGCQPFVVTITYTMNRLPPFQRKR